MNKPSAWPLVAALSLAACSGRPVPTTINVPQDPTSIPDGFAGGQDQERRKLAEERLVDEERQKTEAREKLLQALILEESQYIAFETNGEQPQKLKIIAGYKESLLAKAAQICDDSSSEIKMPEPLEAEFSAQENNAGNSTVFVIESGVEVRVKNEQGEQGGQFCVTPDYFPTGDARNHEICLDLETKDIANLTGQIVTKNRLYVVDTMTFIGDLVPLFSPSDRKDFCEELLTTALSAMDTMNKQRNPEITNLTTGAVNVVDFTEEERREAFMNGSGIKD